MNKTFEESRIEYVKADFFNERNAELEKIGDAVFQIEQAAGGFLIEHVEGKVFAAQNTTSGKLKAANKEIRSLKKKIEALTGENTELLKRAQKREENVRARQMYEFMLLSAINELGRILGGLPREFTPLLKWKRYGDFASARQEYCKLSGIPEKSLLPDPDGKETE